MYKTYTIKYSPCFFFTYPHIAQIKRDSSLQKAHFTTLLQTESLFDDLQKGHHQKAQKLFVFAGLTEWGRWTVAAGRKIRQPADRQTKMWHHPGGLMGAQVHAGPEWARSTCRLSYNPGASWDDKVMQTPFGYFCIYLLRER